MSLETNLTALAQTIGLVIKGALARVSTLENNKVDKTDFSSLSSSVATNTRNISTNSSSISSLQSTVTQNTTDISNTKTNVSTNTSDISSLKTRPALPTPVNADSGKIVKSTGSNYTTDYPDGGIEYALPGFTWYKLAQISNSPNGKDAGDESTSVLIEVRSQTDFGNTANNQNSFIQASFGVRGGDIKPVFMSLGSAVCGPYANQHDFRVYYQNGQYFLYMRTAVYSISYIKTRVICSGGNIDLHPAPVAVGDKVSYDATAKAWVGTNAPGNYDPGSLAWSYAASPGWQNAMLGTNRIVTDADLNPVVSRVSTLESHSTKVDIFGGPASSGSFTWNMPAGAQAVEVWVIGAGGGGGSGRQGASGTARCGGAGGAGGGINFMKFRASDISSSVAVNVGAGGVGGAAATTADSDGKSGVSGTTSSFGGYLSIYGASGGAGGTASSTSTGGYVSAVGSMYPGAQGGSGSIGSGSQGQAALLSGGGGGGGGGITTADSAGAGAYAFQFPTIVGNSATTAAGQPGPTSTGRSRGSGGGGGGTASTTAAGMAGGVGGWPGGGGGGGSAAVNGYASGAGGAGANGCVVVITYF